MSQQSYQVPTLAELHQDNADAFKQDRLKQLLNFSPPEAWIKTHKSTGIKYFPVDKTDFLLDRIFGRWRLEIKSIFQIENAVVAIVRIWYWNPVANDWDFHDGTGAMPIQVASGNAPSDLSKINHAAIQMAAPAAVSYAKKDAADNLGKLFGRDVTRKDTISYDPAFKEDPNKEQQEEKAPPPPPPLPPQYQQQAAQPQATAFSANAFAPQQPAQQVQFPDIPAIDF